MQQLRQDYPQLANFLGSWFPDADFEDRTDLEAAKKYRAVAKSEDLQSIEQQVDALLQQEPFPLVALRRTVNRHFEDEQQARAWLTSITAVLKG